jgi:hypothetical protein
MGAKQIFQTALTDVYYNPGVWKEQPGTIRHENNSVYKYVAFSGTTAVAAGDVVCYVAYASDGAEQVVDGANTALGAGVAMAAVAAGVVTTGAVAYAVGWIQIKGKATLSTTPQNTPTFGAALTTSGAAAPGVTPASGYTTSSVGYCYDYTSKNIIADFPY